MRLLAGEHIGPIVSAIAILAGCGGSVGDGGSGSSGRGSRTGSRPMIVTGLVHVDLGPRGDRPDEATLAVTSSRRRSTTRASCSTVGQREHIRAAEKGEVDVAVTITDDSGREPIVAKMIWAWTPRVRKYDDRRQAMGGRGESLALTFRRVAGGLAFARRAS